MNHLTEKMPKYGSGAGTWIDKLSLIGDVRKMTWLLGTLGVRGLTRDANNLINSYEPMFFYGWGLKESKDWVEVYLDRISDPI